MPRDDIPPIARRQDGVFTAEQALTAGWSLGQIRRRRASGQWIKIAGRALGASDLAPTPRAMARAGQLTWPDAVACRTTAAGVHGLPVPPCPLSEVLVGPGRRAPFRVRAYTASVGPGRIVLVDGLRVTDRLSTALDCLAFLPFDTALDLHAWLSSRSLLDRAPLVAAARESVGRPGTRQLLQVLAVTRSGASSAAEHRLHTVMRAARIIGWQAGAQVAGASGRSYVADVLFHPERVIIEVDGERAHSGRSAFVRDRRRQNDLVTAGFLVLRVTWWDLTERPETVIRQITAALRQRRP